MSGGLYLGSVTLDGQQAVTKNLAKNSGGIQSAFFGGINLGIVGLPFLFNGVPNTFNGAPNTLALTTSYGNGSIILDGSLDPINMTKYKRVSVYGNLTSSNTPVTLTIAYSIDGTSWYLSSLAGVIIPPTIGPITSPFSRDFETAAPYVSVAIHAPVILNIARDNQGVALPVAIWSSVAVSSGGIIQLACINNANDPGGIYISQDNGNTWDKVANVQNKHWTSVALSGNGDNRIACADGGAISGSYSGANWADLGAPIARWSSISMSNNGDYQTACINDTNILNNNGIWTYVAGGVWEHSNALPASWSSVSVSGDNGQYQIACINNLYTNLPYGIWTSVNHGATWTQTVASAASWTSVFVSYFGTIYVACSNNGVILGKLDNGIIVFGNLDTNFTSGTSVCIAEDGNYIALARDPGGLNILTFDTTALSFTSKTTEQAQSQNHLLSISTSSFGQYLTTIGGSNVFTAVLAAGKIEYALSE